MSSFLTKVKETFNKVINGPGDAEVQALYQKTEECTSEFLLNTDWNLQAELCEMIKAGNVGGNSEKVLSCLNKRFGMFHPRTQMHCLTTCEACVRSCGPAFHEQLAVSPFFMRIRQAVLDASNPRRDAQVFTKMLTLTEDWARSLPYTVFAETLQDALAAGAQLPHRPAAEKAPLYDAAEYERTRLTQQSSLRSRYTGGGSGLRARARQQGSYDSLGQSPDAAEPGGQRTGMVPPPQIDPAVLADMSEADRAAVVQAMQGDIPPAAVAQGAAGEAGAAAMEGVPAFDASDPEQLRTDIGVASENAALLREMLVTVEPGAERDPVIESLAARCKAMSAALVLAIPRVEDEGLLNEALQTQDALTAVLEMHGGGPTTERLPVASAQAATATATAVPEASHGDLAGVTEGGQALPPPPPPQAAQEESAPDLIAFDEDPSTAAVDPGAQAGGVGDPATSPDPMADYVAVDAPGQQEVTDFKAAVEPSDPFAPLDTSAVSQPPSAAGAGLQSGAGLSASAGKGTAAGEVEAAVEEFGHLDLRSPAPASDNPFNS